MSGILTKILLAFSSIGAFLSLLWAWGREQFKRGRDDEKRKSDAETIETVKKANDAVLRSDPSLDAKLRKRYGIRE